MRQTAIQLPLGPPRAARSRSLARSCKTAPNRGAALLAALCFATALAIALGTYMTLCSRELALSARALQGTRSVELAETGMEDALWALNKGDWSGWTISGTTATKTVSGFSYDGASTGSISIRISNYNGASGTPAIVVTGSVTNASGDTIRRILNAGSERQSMFSNAVAATSGSVRFQSAGSVDSYDSSQGTYSSQTPGYAAIVASKSANTSTATVQLTNAQVNGYIATLASSPSYSSNARLAGPSTASTTRIDTARISASPYVMEFDEVVPTGTMISLNGLSSIGTAGATSPTKYYGTDLNMQGGQSLDINGPVIIVLTGDLILTQNARIHIGSQGSAEIHVAGSVSLGGEGIVNDTAKASNCCLIATGTTGSFSISTTIPLYAAIYSKSLAVTVSSSLSFYGALVGPSVTFSGSPSVHYDVGLRNKVFNGLATPYSVANWRESTAD